MISYVLPTRDRPDEVRRTLAAIERLGDHAEAGGAEVIIVDNASIDPVAAPPRLASGVSVKVLRRDRNESAAGRNAGAQAASPDSAWLVMLDDDSSPLDAGFLAALNQAPPDVAAISADIVLDQPAAGQTRREAGGLPEVFIGCGVAIRREVFLALGGYDAAFDYYAEEYDLAARLLASGRRVAFEPRFRVHHRKVAGQRDFNRIIRRLVRNNGWVQQRYAPESQREAELWETVRRYYAIARKESALPGYVRGLGELCATLRRQPRTPLPGHLYDRLTGLAHAREAVAAAAAECPLGRVALVARGKNAWAVERALAEQGIVPGTDTEHADTLVIATLSPGPMLDAFDRLTRERPGARVVQPWLHARSGALAA